MYTDLQTLSFIVCAQTWYIIVTFDVKAHLQFTLYGIFTTQETNKQLLHKYRFRVKNHNEVAGTLLGAN